jgi:hypothetical protein
MRLQYGRRQRCDYCEPALRTVSRRLPRSAGSLATEIQWPGSTNFNDLLHGQRMQAFLGIFERVDQSACAADPVRHRPGRQDHFAIEVKRHC